MTAQRHFGESKPERKELLYRTKVVKLSECYIIGSDREIKSVCSMFNMLLIAQSNMLE